MSLWVLQGSAGGVQERVPCWHAVGHQQQVVNAFIGSVPFGMFGKLSLLSGSEMLVLNGVATSVLD